MTRPSEHNYSSHVAYCRDLEVYAHTLAFALKVARETLMHYQYGGSSYKQQADKAIRVIDEALSINSPQD